MQFVFLPDVSRLPLYFVNYFVYEIAASLALSNAQKPEYFGVLEQKRVTTQAMAMAIDAQNRPTEEFTNFPVLTSRESGGQTFL